MWTDAWMDRGIILFLTLPPSTLLSAHTLGQPLPFSTTTNRHSPGQCVFLSGFPLLMSRRQKAPSTHWLALAAHGLMHRTGEQPTPPSTQDSLQLCLGFCTHT